MGTMMGKYNIWPRFWTLKLVTMYDEPRRYLGLRMLAFSGERAEQDLAVYHEFAIVGALALDYPYEAGCKLRARVQRGSRGAPSAWPDEGAT